MIDELTVQYQDGKEAYWLGVQYNENPYDQYSQSMSWGLWNQGWLNEELMNSPE
jgi:hypothetical protein